MAKLKAFKGYRPTNDKVKQVASRPYDVLNSSEAREEAKDNIYSLLRIIKPEIGLTPGVDLYTKEVYDKAKSNFDFFKENGWLVQDEEEYLYIYAQTMFGKTQYGIVGCASVDDYMNNVIKKHELTRPDKEEDRMKHVRVTNANMEPVFFSYTAVDEIDSIVGAFVKENNPVFDFTADDGVGHHFWVIKDKHIIKSIIDLFEKLPATYVADGHHRTAAAALVGNEKKRNNPEHTGEESYNYFLAVHFPDNQLTIIDYNRVVKDLSGYSKDEFMDKLKLSFDIEEIGSEVYKPNKLHEFSMYIEGRWYKLTAKPGTYDDSDPIGILDVTILTNQVLKPLLDIEDLRRSKRIDFVGGIRGLEELSKRVDSGEMKVAFALYPVSMKQLIDIANSGEIMPPKTTWFEPKLRSGLVIHELE
ncbi:MAG: DUF1015 domain-containing protein [Lentimicrobiaceae bacterium]|jgi:uncharacterized protein (DUF1015 family)|nr:DUF1015 domain-containing protein [Lentimicrobiaceae bacterium]MBT3453640.1 DUF1015 domain-containing protein [Lentimicrobiaceae bacterium]MBT3817750.1 DUF1015 domain-containing protein [Lentimicrobiaceae bacterium]MBT4061076.1 DUF1015 domain-containing protein [Lentimicrobiaceae bacterium]MBT4191013.1 DUF1015 domain-containing protein [Lentimicrobiaceae bacterium]